MQSEKIINIAIADDHPLVIQGIKGIISLFDGFEIVCEASDRRDLLDQLQKVNTLPDICIIDINMPNLNGYDTLKELKKRWYFLKVLVLTAYCEEYSTIEMIRSGANGLLDKTCTPRKLQHALATIYYNEFYFPEATAKKIFDFQQHNKKALPAITHRELEFLEHCCSEMNYREIGEMMHVNARTAEGFRDSLFAKFNIKTRAGLVMFAMQNGLIPFRRNKFT